MYSNWLFLALQGDIMRGLGHFEVIIFGLTVKENQLLAFLSSSPKMNHLQ